MKKRMRFIAMMVSFVLAFSVAILGKAADAWKIDKPIYGYFYGAGSLHYGDLTAAGADGAKALGFNVVWCRNLAQLDIAQSKGLRGILHAPIEFHEGENYPYEIDSEKAASLMDDPARVALLDALIDSVKNHPALYAYFVCDEPHASLYPGLARLVAHMRERDPAHLAYINLFGVPAPPYRLGTPDYATYVSQFIQTVKPSLLSYDHYNFVDGTNSSVYFLNLSQIRSAALNANIPFMNIVDVVNPYMSNPPANLATLAPIQVRWLNYTSLAYGVQGLWYFKYAERVAAQPAIKEMGPIFVSTASQLQPLKSIAVYQKGGTLPSGAVALPSNAAFNLSGTIPPSGMLMGFFGASTTPTHVMLVNLSLTSAATTTLVSASGQPLYAFNPSTGQWTALGSSSTTVTFQPGCGQLFSTVASGPGSLSFSSASYSVLENGGSATITVKRSSGSEGAVSVSYATSNGTAISGSDYTVATGTLNWAAGEVADKTFTVPITNDAIIESNETVNIALSNATGGATIGTPGSAILTITDDDAVPVVNFAAASQSKAESAGTATITAQLSATSTKAVTVPFTVTGTATSGTDYTITATPITIAAGATAGTATVTITNDTAIEPSETVIVTMGTPTNATKGTTAVHTLTITDDDSAPPVPVVNFSPASQSKAENGGTATITVRLSVATNQVVTVPFTLTGTATKGTDYTISASPVTIPAGATNANITVSIINNTVVESNETVIVIMGTPVNATKGDTTVHTLTITDDDSAPPPPPPGSRTVALSSATYSIAENAGAVTITVTSSGDSSTAASVSYSTSNGTAAAGSSKSISSGDYTAASGTLTWAAGDAAAKTFTVKITNDVLLETDETVNITLSNVVGATIGTPNTAVLTILDDESRK